MSSWMVRTSPRRLPKFHHMLKLTGEGRSIRTPFTILTRGLLWRMRACVTPRPGAVLPILNKYHRAYAVVYRTYF